MLVAVVVVGTALIMMGIEQALPGRHWRQVRGWWARVFVLNAIQAATVYVAGLSWEAWLHEYRLWRTDPLLGTVGAATFGYLAITFANYWWHRARHELPLLWRIFHQVHHSPQRIEVVTSFYKHPLEVLANSLLASVLLYVICGLGPESATGAVLIAGLAELFYHWNVKTPYWLGFIFQRPESHCVHHQRGHHSKNYSDLPLWDMLFGTFHNPRTFDGKCGFANDAETRLAEMLVCVDVHSGRPQIGYRAIVKMVAAPGALVLLGCLQMAGDLFGSVPLKALGAASSASPAPKVFTAHQGLETYSARFYVGWADKGGARHRLKLTPAVNRRIRGPYNRRNAYGAALAYAPVLHANDAMRPVLESVLRFTFCGRSSVPAELGLPDDRADARTWVDIELRRHLGDEHLWKLNFEVQCHGQ
jgi:sterol desaturase/sphingolipid hydroxylase (fatty acid hydroxylase superfamily)